MNTKLETILKETTKRKCAFSLPLDSYSRVNFERNGTSKLFATTIRGVEIPLNLPINSEDPRLEHEQQASFLESIYSARENSAKQIEWALRYGEYTKEKTLLQIIKNLATFGSIKNRENEILDSMAQTYLAWTVMKEAAETLARIPITAKFSEFYDEITKISAPIAQKIQQDYSQILSIKGFADSFYKGDLDMYKVSILCSVKTRKIQH